MKSLENCHCLRKPFPTSRGYTLVSSHSKETFWGTSIRKRLGTRVPSRYHSRMEMPTSWSTSLTPRMGAAEQTPQGRKKVINVY